MKTHKYKIYDRLENLSTGERITIQQGGIIIDATDETGYLYWGKEKTHARSLREIEDERNFRFIPKEEEYVCCEDCGKLNVPKWTLDPDDEFSGLCMECVPE
jgi:hypothetical protein